MDNSYHSNLTSTGLTSSYLSWVMRCEATQFTWL